MQIEERESVGFESLLSHPCAEKNAQEWGTQRERSGWRWEFRSI
jgi:hypothetical protein